MRQLKKLFVKVTFSCSVNPGIRCVLGGIGTELCHPCHLQHQSEGGRQSPGAYQWAPAGTTLAVVGSSNRWLRINRNGNEVWMADWVSHTRVESDTQTQTSTQTASNIDNCCFVDRQCMTDHDWTDGNWAFQNNQCSAHLQTQSEISEEPVSSVAANADNCCDLGWNCTTDEQWRRGCMGFHSNQCKHPSVAIEGSPAFIVRIEETFDLLQDRSPHWYNYTLTGLDKIQEAPQRQGTARIWSADARTAVPTSWAFPDLALEDTLTQLASTLAHEACHIHRHLDGVERSGLVGETACTKVEVAALQAIAPPNNGRLRWLQKLLANIHDPEYQWWN